MLREINKYELSKKGTGDDIEDRKKYIGIMKEVYLEEISSKTMFDEVYNN